MRGDLKSFHKDNIENNNNDGWRAIGRRRALLLFKKAAAQVPAYKDFLKKNKVDNTKVKTWEDFEKVPVINKKNYLMQYSLPSLHWDGDLSKGLVYTSTSGSTGQPMYFSRASVLDSQYARLLQEFIEKSSYGSEKSTLVIICFAMGIWIGGLITYQAYQIISQILENNISIITPGINKPEIIKSLKILAPFYQQVIIVGYPPFVKEILDEAKQEKINLQRINFRFHFAAEAISEKFRDYLKRECSKINIYRDIINIYGSADIGAMAYEGTAGIFLKRCALRRKKLMSLLFNNVSKTPTIAQFNPDTIFFEESRGHLILTGDNSIPLIRYAIGDNGGVLGYSEQKKILERNGVQYYRELKSLHLEDAMETRPFVYVFERDDFSTIFFGINIYPEMIRDSLIDRDISHLITGKFTLLTSFDSWQNQFLEINLEQRGRRKVNKTMEKIILQKVINGLIRKSSEFRELSQNPKKRELIKLKFWKRGDKKYFNPSVKQRWVAKNHNNRTYASAKNVLK